MTGIALSGAEVPVTKDTGAVLAFCENEERAAKNPQCIRCGRCITVCPMHLEPLMLYQFASRDLLDELEDAGILDCMVSVKMGNLHITFASLPVVVTAALPAKLRSSHASYSQ